jgi:hypothetical protein
VSRTLATLLLAGTIGACAPPRPSTCSHCSPVSALNNVPANAWSLELLVMVAIAVALCAAL